VKKEEMVAGDRYMRPFNHSPDLLSIAGSRRRVAGPPPVRPLHRIAQVMQQESVGLRTAARRMNVTPTQARVESEPTCDLTLSDLYRWQTALSVPIAELLNEPEVALSPAVAWRSQLVKAMRTVRSIQLLVDDEAVQTLTITLIQQLIDMMPELTDVPPWPSKGRPRTSDELGAIAEKPLPDEFFDGVGGY
jgi:hypothetical protein